MTKAPRLNERIRISPVRVIDHDQQMLGVMSIEDALSRAREAGLDLVEVSPNEHPPVCRIMDYGKHIYEKKKRLKVASQSHTTTLKEIRLRPKTDEHDRGIKVKHARDFLEEGHKVQFTMLFRGRERVFRDRAIEVFNEIVAELGEIVKVERPAFMDGRRMTLVVAPGKRTKGGAHSTPSESVAVAPRPVAPPPQSPAGPQLSA